MSRLVKIVDNKYVQIEEHRKPNISFNTNEYDDFENYCTLRETFDPFEMFYENQKYKEVINKAIEFSNKNWGTWCSNHLEYMTELQNILKEVE